MLKVAKVFCFRKVFLRVSSFEVFYLPQNFCCFGSLPSTILSSWVTTSRRRWRQEHPKPAQGYKLNYQHFYLCTSSCVEVRQLLLCFVHFEFKVHWNNWEETFSKKFFSCVFKSKRSVNCNYKSFFPIWETRRVASFGGSKHFVGCFSEFSLALLFFFHILM